MRLIRPLKLPAMSFIACVAVAASLAGAKLVPQYESVSRVAQREGQLDLQLKDKGEQLLSCITGAPAHLAVTARCGVGMRKQYWHYIPDANSRGGYAVNAVQEKCEKYGKKSSQAIAKSDLDEDTQKDTAASSGSYENSLHTEKREYTRLDQSSEEGFWTERVNVCAVVERGDAASLEEALTAGLGLDPVRGDTVRVIVRTK